MKRKISYGILLSILVISACKKEEKKEEETITPASPTCSSIADNSMLMDGKEFKVVTTQVLQCVTTNINGSSWYTHMRTVSHGSGTNTIQPDINITLSSVPPNGTTTSYTVDNGMWQISSSPAPEGKATIRMGNYYDNGTQEYWFGDTLSGGSLKVTMDENGVAKFNLSDIKLVRSGGNIYNEKDRKKICGKNLLCN
jgi:hypothetical protein